MSLGAMEEKRRFMHKSEIKQFKTATLSILKMVENKKVKIYAAAVDYFLFISLIPFLMLLVSLIRFLPFDQADIMRLFADTASTSVYTFIRDVVASIYENGSAASVVALLLALYSASKGMRPLIKGLDWIYGDERRDSGIVLYLKSIQYLAVLDVVVVLSVGVLVYGELILELLNAEFAESAVISLLLSGAGWLRYVIVLCLLTCIFLLFYCRVPANKRKPSGQWPGAVFCAFAWVIFSWAFSVYVSVSDKFGAYGYLGTIMVAVTWMYYCLIFLFIGGCINVYAEEK